MKNMTSPYKKNCAGEFIVEDGMCMLCCIPESEAPDLMQSDDSSCYFVRQPVSKEEIEQAVTAVNVSCCNGVIYTGKDPSIVRMILDEPFEYLDTVPNARFIDIWYARTKRLWRRLTNVI